MLYIYYNIHWDNYFINTGLCRKIIIFIIIRDNKFNFIYIYISSSEFLSILSQEYYNMFTTKGRKLYE